MRNLDSLIVFLLFVVCAEQLIAQPPVNVQQRQQRYRQLLQRFDVDGNGQLDPSEKQALQRLLEDGWVCWSSKRSTSAATSSTD